VRRATRRRLLFFLFLVCILVAGAISWPRIFVKRETKAQENSAEAKPDRQAKPHPDASDPARRAVEELKKVRQYADKAARRKGLEGIAEKYATVWAGKRAKLELGFMYYADKSDRLKARNYLSDGLAACADRAELLRVRKMIEQLNQFLVLNPYRSKDVYAHTVKRGETLSSIAKRYKTTDAFIKRINGLRTDRIMAGKKLFVPIRDMSVKISKSAFELVVYYGPYYFKSYPVGLGKGGRTPLGKFVIAVKTKNPVWYPGDGRVVPFGSPENPLGTRWLGFEKKPGASGYGIHGTSDAASIGKESSNGCVRMHNRDVEELFDMLPRGTEVVIEK